ncbi:MAG TPA: MaoC/PaaZ C-terminal domain-containing protein [Actinomycetota bacterium]|nr:MaoC/PaaZ C-terminal domain-containing protein [Actinomycetota bacterium]
MNVGDELEPLTHVVTRADIRAYAEAGGDRNPLHLDDDVARAAGFDGVIAHGMFTMGHMASCVVAWAGAGAFVERISAQFRAPVRAGETIVAGGRVKAIDDDRVTVEAWVELARDGQTRDGQTRDDQTEWPVRKGEVVVRLAGPVGTGVDASG